MTLSEISRLRSGWEAIRRQIWLKRSQQSRIKSSRIENYDSKFFVGKFWFGMMTGNTFVRKRILNLTHSSIDWKLSFVPISILFLKQQTPDSTFIRLSVQRISNGAKTFCRSEVASSAFSLCLRGLSGYLALIWVRILLFETELPNLLDIWKGADFQLVWW